MTVLYHRDLTTDLPPQRELTDALSNTFVPERYTEPNFLCEGFIVGKPAFFLSGNRFFTGQATFSSLLRKSEVTAPYTVLGLCPCPVVNAGSVAFYSCKK